ncbi:MAG: cobalt-precorrin 5A hydrolase, partial [Desulfitobacteriaceae bacterium]|nr:cobalt-precorrin 5A hydrolase [Desulfitobacteriaceae bacterium]
MGDVFKNYREIIMVMSCGIAVRSIAPYIKSKLSDPAVVVLDEKGNHVISLLSGHLGGANHLAKEVAKITGGEPVITTASDNLGLESVDMLAKRNDLVLSDMEQVKKVTATLVNGEKVAIVCDGWRGDFGENLISMTKWEVPDRKPDAVIYIGNQEKPWTKDLDMSVAKLYWRNLVIGVGCKKNIAPEEMFQAVEILFREHNLSLKAVRKIATVDLKQDEPAILNLAQKLGVDIQIVERKDISAIENNFSCSPFVKEKIGVGCACEPAAFLASRQGKCLVPKKNFNGITLCVYELVAEETVRGLGR